MDDVEPTGLGPDDGLDAFREYMQQRDQGFESVLHAINAEFGTNLQLTCDACPVLIEGQIDGWTLYFRSRWDYWRVAIASELNSAVRATRQAEAAFYHESPAGLGGFDASWLEPTQVDQVLRACLTAFRAGQTNAGYVELDGRGE